MCYLVKNIKQSISPEKMFSPLISSDDGGTVCV